MPTRRQEKVARVIKEAVSSAIANHLNDPRIKGLISVTHVEVGTDMRNADVYLSIFSGDSAVQNRTFEAIQHARRRIQAYLGNEMKSKFCPVLHLHRDDKFKKTIETLNIIEQVASEFNNAEPEDSVDEEQW